MQYVFLKTADFLAFEGFCKNYENFPRPCLLFIFCLAALSLRMKELRKNAPLLPTVSLGYTAYDPMKGSLQEALELADQKMYRFKQQVHAGENAESI